MKNTSWVGWLKTIIRHGERILLCALVGLWAGLTGCSSKEPPAPRWNVLLVTLDTVRADHLGCYGYERNTTPNLDRLAARSVLFENVACQVPITLPSHCSILTGLYPQAHGVRSNGTYRLTEEHVTLAEILSEQGYWTGAVVSAFCLAGKFGTAQGFDYYEEGFSEPLVPGAFPPESGAPPAEFTRDWLFYRYRQPYQKPAEEVTRLALETLQQQGQKPFFLWLHYFDPHAPYAPPPPYHEMFYQGKKDDPANTSLKEAELLEYLVYPGVTDRQYYVAQYDGEIRYADEQFGKVLDYLQQSGLRERTLVIVTADHGESLGEHGHFFNHGNSVYEPSVKVPLLICLPDGRFAGRRTEASVALIDLFPTVLELLHLPSSQPVQGRSLLPLMEGGPKQPVSYYLETIQPEYKQPGGMLRGLLQGRYKYIRTDGFGPTGEIQRELYDLQADPEELQNLVASRSEQTDQMENELLQLAASGTVEAQKAAQKALPAEDLERLRGLGYFGPGAGAEAVNLLDLRIEEASQALRINPGNVEAHFALAEAFLRKGLAGEAIREYQAVLRLKSEHRLARLRLAHVYAEEEQWERAAEQYSTLIQQTPGHIEPYIELARLYVRQRRWEDALRVLQSAARQAPDNPLIPLAMGNCWAEQGDLAQAAHYWRQALRLDPSFEPALSNLRAIGRSPR